MVQEHDLSQCLTENTLSQREHRPEFRHIYLHHYRTKSVEEFKVKGMRGRADGDKRAYEKLPPEEYNVYKDDSLKVNVERRLDMLSDNTRTKRLRSILL